MEALLENKLQTQSKQKSLVLSIFLTGIFMGALDHGIVGPALSSIVTTFGINTSWGVWSFTIYTLLFAVSIPLMGKFSDRFGRKQVFMSGILLFGLGSLLSGIAPNFLTFLIGRSIQAIGTGGIFPITAAYITVSYPVEERAKAMGWIGVVFGFGSIMGPIVGGYIIQHFAWQWIFLINVPISILVILLMSTMKIPQTISKKPIDYLGIILLTAMILSIMLGITSKNITMLIIGVLLVPLFIKTEKNSQDPIIKLNYFKSKYVLVVLLLSLMSGFIMASTMNLLPLYIETNFEVTKAQSSYGVAPLAVASMIASLIGGYLVSKWGAKNVLFLGFSITLIGSLSFIFPVNYLLLLISAAIAGFGIGIIIGAPLNILIIQGTSMQEAGSAVGLLSLFRSLGSTVGPTIAGIILSSIASGFSYVFAVLMIVSSIALLLFINFKK
ncbi:MFS transporter [Metabacillus litoralis]|uniref:MFS transporter n=1 Tax=Metabacillus litoralis TaxID=152268 RepID=UPI0020405C0E|nr:MFS transporter [Metabacillus litoralis]MCM3162261.1 MFS transporter [Metabacillus litoralis]